MLQSVLDVCLLSGLPGVSDLCNVLIGPLVQDSFILCYLYVSMNRTMGQCLDLRVFLK